LPFKASRIPTIDEGGKGDNRPTTDIHGGPTKGNYAAKVVVEHNDNGGPKAAVKHRIIQKGYTNLLSPPGYNSALICLIVSSVVFTEFAIILTFVMAAA
jgi:hypothetical protein